MKRAISLGKRSSYMQSEKREKRRGPTTAAPVEGNSGRHLENRRPRLQASADPDPT
jgi:hypothetical protein